MTNATVIFSGVTERCVCRWGEDPKMNKARRFINSAMAQYMADTGGVFIDNKEITQKRSELFRWDGVHLSDKGNYIFFEKPCKCC